MAGVVAGVGRGITVWFVADTHFGEQPRTRQRLSGMDAGTLDELMMERWRATVAAGDDVWHLGDVGRDWQRLADLPGTKHLIFGNTDKARTRMAASPVFASTAERRILPTRAGPLFLIHIPEQAGDAPPGMVVHGHHHHRDPKPGQRSVSVDRTGWAPIALDALLV